MDKKFISPVDKMDFPQCSDIWIKVEKENTINIYDRFNDEDLKNIKEQKLHKKIFKKHLDWKSYLIGFHAGRDYQKEKERFDKHGHKANF